MRLIMKFGGTSVGDGERMRRVAEIIATSQREGNDLVVVVSAMAGVTDQLIGIATEVTNGVRKPPIDPFIESLRERHRLALEVAAPDLVTEVGSVLDERLESLKNILNAVFNLSELTPRSKDYIISFGERLSAPILSAALRHQGISSDALDGCEAGIITTPNHGDALAIPSSEARIRGRVIPLLASKVPVIMGFMGCTERGVVTTLGRSGSDYSATIVGAAIGADEIWIWTDVDGVMTSDPRLIKDARVVPSISYLEAMELSYFGAKVLHPRSLEPAMRKNIPVRVKNTFNPTHPGTVVYQDERVDTRVVKAITLIEKVALVNVTGVQMIGRPGVAKTIFAALADKDVNIMMISQGSSEANISLIIEESHLENALDALSEVHKSGYFREVTSDRDVVAIAVVGAGMAGTPGIAGRIFTALGTSCVNIMMISQGSSEANISLVVKTADGKRAVQILHDEFNLAEALNE
ncbi:MAG: aspartate kinase [Methanomicrobiales archaeon]|nr:aspartate kinase [Methanomicrobiales archaeon]